MILDELVLAADRFAATGWTLKPEGACRADVCVPLPPAARDDDGNAVVPVVAERLGMPLVRDERHDVWALGPATIGGRALPTAEAPELTLPDITGLPFTLSSLLGRKVLLLAWASW